ncbi:unnamed protein product, partial [marine sediment metagenome]
MYMRNTYAATQPNKWRWEASLMTKPDSSSPLTDQEIKEIKELYDQGFTDGEIAEKMGIPSYRVSFHRRDLELDKVVRLFTDEQLI